MTTASSLQPMNPKTRFFGLVLCLVLYVVLSAFSTAEVNDLTGVLTTQCLRYKLTLVFVIAVLLPIYLVYLESTLFIIWLKVALEVLPLIILIGLYVVSRDSLADKASKADIVAILITDIVASAILILFKIIKHR